MLVKMSSETDFMPDVAGVIVGWRAWALDTKAATLHARTGVIGGENVVWPPRAEMVAKCLDGGAHTPPVADCHCGIYAARDRDHLVAQQYQEPNDEDDALVFGTVALWGRVMRCERGWRAQYAYPRKLWVPFSFARHAARLEDLYGVPVGLANPFTLGKEN
jgi:hypothetical protein